MKFKDVKTLEHLLKEYGSAVGGGGHGTSAKANKVNKSKSIASGPDVNKLSPTVNPTEPQDNKPVRDMPATAQVKAKDLKDGDMVVGKDGKMASVYSIVGQGSNPQALITKDEQGKLAEIPQDQTVDAIQKGDSGLETLPDEEPAGILQRAQDKFKAGSDFANRFIVDGKLSKIAKRKGKKLKIKDLKGKIKKLTKKRLKEADPKLFEINFNKKEIAREALDLPVRCGFEAETFWYHVDTSSGYDIDDMTLDEVESEYGIPDSAYEDYQEWINEKARDEYLPDLIDRAVEDEYDNDEYREDFARDVLGDEAVQNYKDEFEDKDPYEFENREEDGWDDENWRNDLIDEEYEDEYKDFLYNIFEDDEDLYDEAQTEAEGDYSMDEWVSEVHYSMSSFLDDYGWDYQRYGEGGIESVADIFHSEWQKDNSRFKDYPETGDYGDTSGSETEWAIEKDSTIDPDEGAGAEIISPVFDSPREMLKELKSLIDWNEYEGQFSSNRSTGLHITMSWQGKGRGGRDVSEPNKLKMALLLGDEYLLRQFDRLRNTYSKSQYQTLLKYAEKIQKGDKESFLKLQSFLDQGISKEKYSSIHFKDNYKADSKSGNQLIEFRIAGNDYVDAYEKVVKAVIRYSTIMKAGYDDEAYRKDYISAISRLVRKSTEVKDDDPDRYADVDHPVLDSAKEIASKKEYFDAVDLIHRSLQNYLEYKNLSQPGADKEWKKSIDDYRDNTGRDPSWMGENINEEEGITGYIEPDSIPPSERAKEKLKKAQDTFATALALLARMIDGGTARSTPKAKDIGNFRKYAKELNLPDSDLGKLMTQKMDDANYREMSDEENLNILKNGAMALFKKDIVDTPDYFKPQDFDLVADSLWQFSQTSDAKDNVKVGKLIDILADVNARLEKEDIQKTLLGILKTRQKNDAYRRIKDGSYGEQSLIRMGMVSDQKAIDKLKKFLEPYQGYEHPTARDHHVNIHGDDNYAQVFQYNLIQKMRTRLDYLKKLQRSEPEKAEEMTQKLVKAGETFISNLKPFDTIQISADSDLDIYDGSEYMGMRNPSERQWNDYLDILAKLGDKDDDTYNIVSAFDNYIIEQISLEKYFRHKKENPGAYKHPEIKAIIKDRFKNLKNLLTNFDKTFQAVGFTDIKKEIASKNTLDRRNKDFEKNIRNNAVATLNIPSHSFVYISKQFFDTLDAGGYENFNYGKSFNDELNGGDGRVFVIPSAHWSQANDAYEGLQLIKNFEGVSNYFHSWRKTGYNKILSKFRAKYSATFKELTDQDGPYYSQNSVSFKEVLTKNNIEITHHGDSRSGMPGVKELVDPEDLKNPISDEPINRGSAFMWDQTTDDAEQKRLDAFDFSVYPKKMKELVQRELDDGDTGSFQLALQNVMQRVVDKGIDLRQPKDRMISAAGVEGMEGASSAEVADKTNWSNLTDFLKLERGVNDQGVNLLKRVYDQFDSDHNWRPKGNETAIGTDRWAAAVMDAVDYIRDGYNVSGGNYFRKNQDGSDGDDVSSLYSRPVQRDDDSGFDVTTDDYEAMRRRYFDFNAMMMNGMQNYIVQPDVNRLVAFLKNPDNDESFKEAVLHSMRREYEAGELPNDFQGHLARGRMYLQSLQQRNNESIYNRFENLPLEEQLVIIESSEVLEKWSKKYKASINCSNPKGFSQKAHCAGKKKKKTEGKRIPRKKGQPAGSKKHSDLYTDENPKGTIKGLKFATVKDAKASVSKIRSSGKKHAHKIQAAIAMEQRAKAAGKKSAAAVYRKYINQMKKKTKKMNEGLSKVSQGPASDGLPDNSIPYLLNKLLAEPFPAHDLRKQMDAYWALPIPQMLSDFRGVRAEGGAKADLRNVLKQYINSQLDPQIKKHVKLTEGKDEIIQKIEDLPDEDEKTNKIVSYIEQLLDDMGVGGRLASLTQDLEQIDNKEVKKSSLKLAKIIASIEMIPLDRAQLFASWKKDSLVDIEKMLSGSAVHFSEVFKGYGRDDYMTELIDDLAEVQAYGIGAGEFLLAVLSSKIAGIGATGGSGDLIIDGRSVEVKTKTSKNARFYDDNVKPDQTWASKTEGFKLDFADIDEVATMPTSGMNQTQLVAMLQNPKLTQDTDRMKKALRSLAGILQAIMPNITPEQIGEIVKTAKSGDVTAFKQTYGAYNILNYLNVKRSKGDLEGILFMNKQTKMLSYIKSIEDIRDNYVLDVNTIYPISNTIRNPFPQIGLVAK